LPWKLDPANSYKHSRTNFQNDEQHLQSQQGQFKN